MKSLECPFLRLGRRSVSLVWSKSRALWVWIRWIQAFRTIKICHLNPLSISQGQIYHLITIQGSIRISKYQITLTTVLDPKQVIMKGEQTQNVMTYFSMTLSTHLIHLNTHLWSRVILLVPSSIPEKILKTERTMSIAIKNAQDLLESN